MGWKILSSETFFLNFYHEMKMEKEIDGKEIFM